MLTPFDRSFWIEDETPRLTIVHTKTQSEFDLERLTDEHRDAKALVRRWKREQVEVAQHLAAAINAEARKREALVLVTRVREQEKGNG